jgi:hypothetical protein
MEEIALPEDKIRQLRTAGVLKENEVAAQSGDLIVAIDVVTQARRVITADNLTVTEGSLTKRLLKG